MDASKCPYEIMLICFLTISKSHLGCNNLVLGLPNDLQCSDQVLKRTCQDNSVEKEMSLYRFRFLLQAINTPAKAKKESEEGSGAFSQIEITPVWRSKAIAPVKNPSSRAG
jgi:hypothetical protein